jgi:hypothetical protein
MDHLGYINAEGGPLLVADSVLVPYWKGIEGPDYDRARAIFDDSPEIEGAAINIGPGRGLLWEMQGAGTADVFKNSESHICVTRIWPHDPRDSTAPQSIAGRPVGHEEYIGDLLVESGRLTILWAAEDGSRLGLPSDAVHVGRPTGDMAIDTAGLVMRVSRSHFACFHDYVETSVGNGRRLHLIAT